MPDSLHETCAGSNICYKSITHHQSPWNAHHHMSAATAHQPVGLFRLRTICTSFDDRGRKSDASPAESRVNRCALTEQKSNFFPNQLLGQGSKMVKLCQRSICQYPSPCKLHILPDYLCRATCTNYERDYEGTENGETSTSCFTLLKNLWGCFS